ncbi:MAG: permease [Planctomycetes bacterium]|nr:permease [Planctomycetota bacterium]
MLLLFSFLALALGPLLVLLARKNAWSTVGLDAFCLVTICGLSLLHLLPESAAHGGWLVLPLALVGFLLPTFAERTLHHGFATVRRTVLTLAVLGIAAHACLDGLFLVDDLHTLPDGHIHDHEVTAWAIILHRIPEGLGIWWIVPRTLGVFAAVLITLVSVGSTMFGYFLGAHVLTDTSQQGLALLQSLLLGSLLHVVLHSHIPAPREQGRWRIASVAGAIAGVFVLWLAIHDHFPAQAHGGPGAVFLRLAMDSAPALLFAYALVGLCHAFLPANWLRRMTEGPAILQALRGVAVGLPLPVCSCGVVPIYRELVRQGATLAAAIAFLVATPELEVAAVMLTWRLMGGEMALVRVGMAAVLALGTGVVVAKLAGARRNHDDSPAGAMPEAQTGPLGERLRTAFRFGFGPAVDNTATWILTGLLMSALLMPYLDAESIRAWTTKYPGFDVPIAALLGLPLYVCATGSTPVAATLLGVGVSPGAVLALLLTGPATNVTTFGVLAKLHGARVAVVFALSMGLGATLLGWLVNAVVPASPMAAPTEGHVHSETDWLVLGLLGVVFFLSLLRQGVRPFLERLFESPANLGHGESPGCCAEEAHGHSHHGHGHHEHEPAAAEHTHPPTAQFSPRTDDPLRPPPRPVGGGHDCCGHG